MSETQSNIATISPSELAGGPKPKIVDKPTPSAKGERVRAQQESGTGNEGGDTGPMPGTPDIDTLSVMNGQGPGKPLEFTSKGRVFTLRPFGYDDWDAALEALTKIPIILIAYGIAEPGKADAELSVENVMASMNRFRSPEDAFNELETVIGSAMLLVQLTPVERVAMRDLLYYAFKREEDDQGREYKPEDIHGLLDLANFPMYLRLIFYKNVLLLSRFLG